MSELRIKYPKLEDYLLKDTVRREKIFMLNTNLSELGGPGVNFLSESLMGLSMLKPNKTIIELIMYENQYVFRTREAIQKIMNKDWQVMQTFVMLGNHNMHCNLLWLIECLLRLGELVPLKDILYGAPPMIRKLTPEEGNIRPGETIRFEIRTVSSAKIVWFKSDSYGTTSFGDTRELEDCSINKVSYQTMQDEEGLFFIVATSLGKYNETSEKIFVGKQDILPDYVPAHPEGCDQKPIIRVALLIGIMKYKSGHELAAPKHDIAELDPILRKIGFTVHNFGDLPGEQFVGVLETFSRKYVNDKTYIFFYFAGHGMSENKKDYVQLTGNSKLGIIEILNILSKNNPKVLSAVFDMCRNDVNNKDPRDIKKSIKEANLPISDSLMLVMSTFPSEKAFEMQKKFESHSQIIKPLCNCLVTYACKDPINIAITHFVNDPSISGQKPVIYSGPMRDVIGQKGPTIEIFRLKSKRVDDMHIDLDFKFDVFHNMININLHSETDFFRNSDYSVIGENVYDNSITFNLFNMKQSFDSDDNCLKLKIYRRDPRQGNFSPNEIFFKIILPPHVLDFFF